MHFRIIRELGEVETIAEGRRIDNSEYPASLELHKIYRVIADRDALQDGDLRIVDESGEDYLEVPPRIRGILGRPVRRRQRK